MELSETFTFDSDNTTPYSFDDWAKSLFVLNLWLPNIGSGVTFQYLYTLLESSVALEITDSVVLTYEDFCGFVDFVRSLLPEFAMLEDYVPEPDWGEIKYYFRQKLYKVFYGGELANSINYYYAFEILHSGFDDFYKKEIGRSALDELSLCLHLQDSILEAIPQPFSNEDYLDPGVFETPSQEFWSACIDFLQDFAPFEGFSNGVLRPFTKHVDETESRRMPTPAEFTERVHSGENCFFWFLTRGHRNYPVMPRRYISILYDSWGKVLRNYFPDIQKRLHNYELRIAHEFVKFFRTRHRPNNLFDFVCALEKDERPHKTVFSIAFIARDHLFLLHIATPFLALVSNKDDIIKDLSDAFGSATRLLSASPLRFGLMAQGKTLELKPVDGDLSLSILPVGAIPSLTIDSPEIRILGDFPGELIPLTDLLGIIDESRNVEELCSFFDFANSIRNETQVLSPLSSTFDLYAAFRDSDQVLIAGAISPTALLLEPHWGSNFQYKSLKRFWSAYPKTASLGNPKGWRHQLNDGPSDVALFSSRTSNEYFRVIQIFDSELFIRTPTNLLGPNEGKLTEVLMNCLADAFTLYKESIDGFRVWPKSKSVAINFYPGSLVKSQPIMSHLEHLLPTSKLWKMDSGWPKTSQLGVRIVFDDTEVSSQLTDAADRSIQITLFVDVMRQLTGAHSNSRFREFEGFMESEKLKANRFRFFAVEKTVSFKESSPVISPQLRDFKLADKEIALIAKRNDISPGDYDGQSAKAHIRTLIKELVKIVNERVSDFNAVEVIPLLISNIDAATHSFESAEARTENSLDQEVDYSRESVSGQRRSEYLHLLQEHHYLIEKFVQINPSGHGKLTSYALGELLALVSRLLLLYAVSDQIHYNIFPTGLHVSHDYLVSSNLSKLVEDQMEEWAREQAQVRLGIRGTADTVGTFVDPVEHLEGLSHAFRTDFGFSFGDFVLLQSVLATWALENPESEQTYYKATLKQIEDACLARIEGFEQSCTKGILDFLTLRTDKVLILEGSDAPAIDLPVWEHRKRSNRYGLRPIIKFGDRYYWGPYSVDRSNKVWKKTVQVHKLPSDLDAPSVTSVLERFHEKYRVALQDKIIEIIGRFTTQIRSEISPSKVKLSETDIGDIDVFALMPDRRTILNIESKVIDQAYTNKDIKRVSEKVFGRTNSKGRFEFGYVHRVETRHRFLESSGRPLAEKYWGSTEADIKVVSIFVTPVSFWWTKFPPIETAVHFVELRLLDDFIRSISRQ